MYLKWTQPFLVTISIALLCHTRITAAAPPVAPTLTLNVTATGNVQCIDSPDWVTIAFQPYDCFSAIGLFEENEVYRHATRIFEFVAAAITPAYRQFSQMTPRRYTYKTCTLTIAMLSDIPLPLPSLPPPPQQRRPRTDLSSFHELAISALNVRDGCLSILEEDDDDDGRGRVRGRGEGELGRRVEGEVGRRGKRVVARSGTSVGFANPAGYDIAGLHDAIGVFLWDSNSAMDRALEGRVRFAGRGVGVGLGAVDTA